MIKTFLFVFNKPIIWMGFSSGYLMGGMLRIDHSVLHYVNVGIFILLFILSATLAGRDGFFGEHFNRNDK